MNTPYDDAPIIATLALDPRSFARLDSWRQAHFPDRGYSLPAHLTLFHKLPPHAGPRVARALGPGRGAVPLIFQGLRPLARGTAVDAESPALHALRARIAKAFAGELTKQDSRPAWRPHVTVQNKVDPEQAERDRMAIAADFAPWSGYGPAVLLWRYLGGPWEFEASIPL